MILFLVCVCVGLACVCALLAFIIDRTRRNAGKEIGDYEAIVRDMQASVNECRSEHEGTLKKLADLEVKRIKGIQEMALDMTRLESKAELAKDELAEATSLNEFLNERLATVTTERDRLRDAFKKYGEEFRRWE